MPDYLELTITPPPEVVVEVTNTAPPVLELSIKEAPNVITVYETGPQGPEGPQGPGAESYLFIATSPIQTWTINHNLGFKPIVELFNSGSREIDGDVLHTSVNQTLVVFTLPVSGFARLN